MSDPIEELTRLGDAMEGAPMPLPASEIRARGDRIRRRRHAVVAASAAVVVIVAVPVVALTSNGSGEPDRLTPQPTVSEPTAPTAPTAPPSASWPTVIPDDFPLTDGWPEDDGSDEFQLTEPRNDNQAMLPAGELDACAQPVDSVEPEDRLTTRLAWGSDHYIREIQLFADSGDASAYLDSIQDAYAVCEADGPTVGAPSFTTGVNQGSIGEESVVITRASDGIGRVVINVVQVGNAVTVDIASDEGTGDTVVDLATETRENLADVVAAMNDLQGGGASADDLSEPATTTVIPADFPLDLALSEPPVEDSETTIEGPAADVEGVRPQTACGASLSMPGSPDPEHQLGYAISTIGGYDGRSIHAHPTVQDAVDQMEQLRSQIQGCGRDNGGDGLSDRLWETFNSDTGYDSITFGWTYEATEFQGPTAGQLYTVVRVGNAILALEWGSEGSARSQADSAPDQVELARLIGAEMCVFTVDGC